MKLGVNIDHVATLRQARGGKEPSVLIAALDAVRGGADGITVHLREDRRHIQDYDVLDIKKSVHVPLNLEMALDEKIVKFALKVVPDKVCLVPEKRRELTTEGGLDAASKIKTLKRVVPALQKKGIEVSLFIDPVLKQINAAAEVGANAIEIHTGTYANATGTKRVKELQRIRKAVTTASKLDLIVNAGHGLDYQNVVSIAAISRINELNIGHSIVCRSVFVGLRSAVNEMKKMIK